MNSATLESSWVKFIALVRFDDKDGQKIQCMYPPIEKDANAAISPQFIQDLKMLCMPDCLEAESSHELIYMTRIRDKLSSEGNILNCFISFRQCPDPGSRRGYFQQSLVLVSTLPYISLFYRILHRLSTVLADIPQFERLDPSIDNTQKKLDNNSILLPINLEILYSTIEVAYQHFLQWSEPCIGRTLQLPFYGIMINYEVPVTPLYALFHPQLRDVYNIDNLLIKISSIDGYGGLYHGINLVAVFHRLGLLPHLWTLWEQVITGKSIVVWSSSAAIASTVVTALVSLISPLAYAGDYRPYINPYDSDTQILGDIMTATHNERLLNKASKSNISPLRQLMQGSNVKKDSFDVSSTLSTTIDSKDYLKGPTYVKYAGLPHRNPRAIIVGITNPFLLKTFSYADVVLFIPNPDTKFPATFMKQASDKASSSKLSSKKSNDTLFKSSTKLSSVFGSLLAPSSLEDKSQRKVSGNLTDDSIFKPSNKFSALGIGIGNSKDDSFISPSRDDARIAPSPTPMKAMLGVKVRKLRSRESINDIYDEWVAAGGLKVNSNHRHVLLSYRSKPIIEMDVDIDARLSALLSPITQLPNDINQRFEANKIRQPSRDSITDDPSDKEVIGNMLLREHFRNLTLAMLKPFEKYFHMNRDAVDGGKVHSSKTSSSSSSSSIEKSASRDNILNGSPGLSATRVGASSMLLYVNPNNLFGLEDVNKAVDEYKIASEMYGYNHMPLCLRRCADWDVLVKLFASSDNFQAWSDWRRDLLVIRLLLDTSRMYQDVSLSEIIRAYAIEQGYQIVTATQLKELIDRIKNTLQALTDIQSKYQIIAAILYAQYDQNITSKKHAIVRGKSSSDGSMIVEEKDAIESSSAHSVNLNCIMSIMERHLRDIIKLAEANKQFA